jgi:hypothetical protein
VHHVRLHSVVRCGRGDRVDEKFPGYVCRSQSTSYISAQLCARLRAFSATSLSRQPWQLRERCFRGEGWFRSPGRGSIGERRRYSRWLTVSRVAYCYRGDVGEFVDRESKEEAPPQLPRGFH